jgi:hypothetical protein
MCVVVAIVVINDVAGDVVEDVPACLDPRRVTVKVQPFIPGLVR